MGQSADQIGHHQNQKRRTGARVIEKQRQKEVERVVKSLLSAEAAGERAEKNHLDESLGFEGRIVIVVDEGGHQEGIDRGTVRAHHRKHQHCHQ